MKLTPQQVAEWHREQSKNHIQMAEALEQSYGLQPMVRYKRTAQSSVQATNGGTLTVQQLEDAVKKKTGRIKDVAARLHVDEESVHKLLEPSSRVFAGDRGWLKIRE